MKSRTTFFSVLLLVLLSGFMLARTPSGPYRGVIAQEDENTPYEAYTFENGLGATFSFQRVDAGQYYMNASANIFPSSAKVFAQTSLYNEGMDATNMCLVKVRRKDGDTLLFSTFQYDGANLMWIPSDNCSFFLEVIVYP